MNGYIVDKNSTGKTRKMLVAAKENNMTVVCKNPIAMADKARCYGIYGLKFVDYAEQIANENVAIDEIGEFIKYHFGANLNALTMTVD